MEGLVPKVLECRRADRAVLEVPGVLRCGAEVRCSTLAPHDGAISTPAPHVSTSGTSSTFGTRFEAEMRRLTDYAHCAG